MSDPISGAALIIAIFSGLASLMNTLHIRKCNALCCKSDCSKQNTPPNSPSPPDTIQYPTPQKKAVSFKDEKHNDNISL